MNCLIQITSVMLFRFLRSLNSFFSPNPNKEKLSREVHQNFVLCVIRVPFFPLAVDLIKLDRVLALEPELHSVLYAPS